MSLLNPLRRFGMRILVFIPLLAVVMLGCGRERPERTEDPEEIDKLRQKHLEHSRREMQESS